MNVLKTDGKYTIYALQHQWEPEKLWTYIEGEFLRDFSEEEFDRYPELNDFTVKGECWKRTGIYGTFNFDAAIEVLTRVVKKYPGLRHRIVKIEIDQKITPMTDMCEGKQLKGGVKYQMDIGLQHAPE